MKHAAVVCHDCSFYDDAAESAAAYDAKAPSPRALSCTLRCVTRASASEFPLFPAIQSLVTQRNAIAQRSACGDAALGLYYDCRLLIESYELRRRWS